MATTLSDLRLTAFHLDFGSLLKVGLLWSCLSSRSSICLTTLALWSRLRIATGLSFGFISLALVKLIKGEAKRQDWLLYTLAIICTIRFIYVQRS
jgi:xanthine/uracil/vitamin C permease (AzgA family)